MKEKDNINESIDRLNKLYLKAQKDGNIKLSVTIQVARSKLILARNKAQPQSIPQQQDFSFLDVLKQLYPQIEDIKELPRHAAKQIIKYRVKNQIVKQ